jgi:hypothetical protein
MNKKEFRKIIKTLKVIVEEPEMEYDPGSNINPIKIPKGGIKIWGQKTVMGKSPVLTKWRKKDEINRENKK